MRMCAGTPGRRACLLAKLSWCAQTYFFTGPSYESQLFHHVHVTGIPYGKKCAPCLCCTCGCLLLHYFTVP